MRRKHITNISFLVSLVTTGCIFFMACQSSNTKSEEVPLADTTSMQNDTTHVFNHLLVDNKKDPSCSMPTSAGIADTAHYKTYILGFCSKECKEAFLKNPEASLAAAEIKK